MEHVLCTHEVLSSIPRTTERKIKTRKKKEEFVVTEAPHPPQTHVFLSVLMLKELRMKLCWNIPRDRQRSGFWVLHGGPHFWLWSLSYQI